MPSRYRAEAKEDPTMPFLALLSDRSPQVALPALLEVAPDLKLEALSMASLAHVLELEPESILVDAGRTPHRRGRS